MITHEDICQHTPSYVSNLIYTNLSYPDLSSSSSVTYPDADSQLTTGTDRTDDDDRKNLFQRIQERANRAGIADRLNDVTFEKLTEQYSEIEIMTAIDKAGMNNGQHFNYVFSILANDRAGKGKPVTEPIKPAKLLNGQNYTQRPTESIEEERERMKNNINAEYDRIIEEERLKQFS